ncbi:MAG: glutamate-1-semialdehyde 2,1-aminomutase [Bacteroidetes bacterium]|nr:glutamate-1-semialdehyde 2,1-aminomutase [Bacteroidota bacterium]
MNPRTLSDQLFNEAKACMPGGVSSPVRAYKAVGGAPVFIDKGQGAWLCDVDQNWYVDYVLSYGPLLAGHAHQEVQAKIIEAIEKGTSFGACTEGEAQLVRKIQTVMPKMEQLRLVNSGTEAVMSALRLARAYTTRDKIIKCTGNYHGHADSLLVEAGSGVATLALPNSPGVPIGSTENTVVIPFNNLMAAEKAFDHFSNEIAAMIIEPVAGNMGVVPPQEGYLEGVRKLTQEHGSLLIFDEVMTGFRVHPGGAQTLYQVSPDLTTLGKVIGGGLPIGAYGGRAEIMALIAPDGPVYQAGTLSGNPVSVAAGLATLDIGLKAWDQAASQTRALMQGLSDIATKYSVPMQAQGVGTMFSCFFTDMPVTNLKNASRSNTHFFADVFQGLLAHQVHIPPSQYEAWFVSTAHDSKSFDQTMEAFDSALQNALSV